MHSSSFAAEPSPGAPGRRRAAVPRRGGRAFYRSKTRRQEHNRARYYDPSIGRFTQEDPIRDPSANSYSYARTNPVFFTDAFGLYSFPVDYFRLPNSEVKKRCGKAGDIGCSSPLVAGKCDCVQTGPACWRAKLKLSLKAIVIYSTDCQIPGEKIAQEEERHLDEFESQWAAVKVKAAALEQNLFKDRATCDWGCQFFLGEMKALMGYNWTHMGIDYTHGYKPCH
jgi:RHS repeat-associated protein